MTIASHELALNEINEGKRYRRRCAAARHPASQQAATFADIARQAARDYERQFGAPDDFGRVFTAEDILLAAAELSDYYTRHNAENDAMEKATS
jgi:hypothetical protein